LYQIIDFVFLVMATNICGFADIPFGRDPPTCYQKSYLLTPERSLWQNRVGAISSKNALTESKNLLRIEATFSTDKSAPKGLKMLLPIGYY
jgi:hypothetical protein